VTILRGQAVTLRRMTAADLDAVTAFFELPELHEAWPGVDRTTFEDQLSGADPGVGLVVEADGKAIGFVQYYEEDDPHYRYASIDIALHPHWCGRGLGTDALHTLARHLFDDRGHHRLTIDPHVGNARAIASYHNVGFRDVGVMRQYELGNDGVWRDSLLMDLLAEEFVR
jgi:aminoglycoside 6'-N-acetyltransferase